MNSLFMTVTEACNRRCPFCFNNQGVGTFSESFLPVDTVRRLVDSSNEWRDDMSFFLTGGEPLLHPELEAIVDLLAAVGHVSMLSNGDLLTPERLAALSRLERIILSIKDVTTRELERLERLVGDIRASGKETTAIHVITRRTFPRIGQLFTAMRTLGLSVLIQPAWLKDGMDHEDSFHRMDPGEWRSLDTLMAEYCTLGGSPSFYRFWKSFYRGNPVVPPYCGMGHECRVLDVHGRIGTCFHPQAESDAFPGCFGEHCLSMFTWI